jgi:hypothetical protein
MVCEAFNRESPGVGAPRIGGDRALTGSSTTAHYRRGQSDFAVRSSSRQARNNGWREPLAVSASGLTWVKAKGEQPG